MRILLILMIISLLSICYSGEYSETRNLKLSGEDIEVLKIDCGAGFLKVQGNEAQKDIEVQADIIVKKINRKHGKDFLEKYLELSLEQKGRKAYLISEVDYRNSFFSSLFGEKSQVVINLTVNVPKNMSLNVDDGSGFIDIKGTRGDIYIDDGSGELTINDIVGNIEIDDGSGEINIENIEGDVQIDDGSGELSLYTVKGNVNIEDGSGELAVVNIEGDVRIDDGSGTIKLEDIEGDVTILNAGSGGVSIKNVSGEVVRKDD